MSQIVVYVDRGVNGMALWQTVKSLHREVNTKLHPIKRMNAQELLSQDWEDKTALLILPGGDDLVYASSLAGLGANRIYRYVARGGHYLGLSGGAFFATKCFVDTNGGCLFGDTQAVQNEATAIATHQIGKGRAILCNMHPEYKTFRELFLKAALELGKKS